MALSDNYTVKPNAIPSYFEAMLDARVPERFTQRFLQSLEFTNTNDRLFINTLKELGFLDSDGVPTDRYYNFLNRSQSERMVAEGVREAYSDLFAVDSNANELSLAETTDLLRTLYKDRKPDGVLKQIASTFIALCRYGDFSSTKQSDPRPGTEATRHENNNDEKGNSAEVNQATMTHNTNGKHPVCSLDSLQYHINIVLPESRDQAVFDAIFKSLREHLGAS